MTKWTGVAQHYAMCLHITHFKPYASHKCQVYQVSFLIDKPFWVIKFSNETAKESAISTLSNWLFCYNGLL